MSNEVKREKPYRLLWFMHFHKSAGSSVSLLAQRNGETLFPAHRNGNPYDGRGNILPLWTYSDADLIAFVDRCESLGVTYVATEWGCPDFRLLRADERVITISLIRDPWTRLVSNYTYDLLNRYERLMPIADYYFHHSLPYRQPEYYCSMLMRGLGKSRAQSRHDLLNAAWENLTSLDFVGDVANPSSFDRLCQVAGWNNASMRVNARPGIVRGTLGRARRGDLGYAYRASRIGSSRWSGIQEFASIFSQVNQADGDLLLRLNGSLGSGLID